MGEFRASLDSFKYMLTLSQSLHNEASVQGWAYNGIGLAYESMGQYQDAIEFAKKDLDIAQQLRDKRGQGRAYCNIGNAYHRMGQYKMAIQYLKSQLEIVQQLNDEPGRGAAFCGLGVTYQKMGQYEAAIRYLKTSLDIARQLHDRPGRRLAYKWLGICYRETGQYDTAIDYAKKQLDIAQQLNDAPGLRDAYSNFGNVYYRLGQHEAAIKYHKKHLEITAELGDTRGQGVAYGNLACAYSGLGQDQTAIDYGHKYLEIVQQLDDKPRQRHAHGDLGVLYARSGQLDLACSHFASSDSLMHQMEAQLADGQWRRRLLEFGEQLAFVLDEWVLAAARSGKMMEALRVEERRRCRSELAYQEDAVRSKQEVSEGELKTMASSADAAFVVIIKMYRGALLTWMLSGESGELLYANITDIEEKEGAIKEWTKHVTFAEWAEWQQAFSKLRKWLKNEEIECQPVSEAEREKAAEYVIKEDMKGDLDEELWASIHDPATLLQTVSWETGASKQLHNHFLQKAEKAMEELSKILWQPIVEKCQALKDAVQGDAPHTKPVSECLFVLSCLTLSFFRVRTIVF